MNQDGGYALGDSQVFPREGYLRSLKGEVRLRPRLMSVLTCLAEANGDVVSRQQLLQAVWAGTEVYDEALSRCISELRKTFKQAGESRTVIETVPKYGYRLSVSVEPISKPRILPAEPSSFSGFNNLPISRSSFVGRGDEIAAVQKMLTSSTFVNITGPGGIGKTRLAVQACKYFSNTEFEAIYFVDLSPLSDADQIDQHIARVVGLPTGMAAGEIAIDLANHIKNRKILLCIDNCEHLITNVAQLIDTLLSQCPKLKILASSRARLNVEGEHSYPLPPLQVEASSPGDQLPSSVQLFIDRARIYDPELAFSEQDLSIIKNICYQLDGLPLAIELAASRFDVVSLAEILSYVNGHPLDFLKSNYRGRSARQQTLESTISWSYQLLNDAEKTLFRRLGVFAGGFNLSACRAVCMTEADEIEVLSLLSDLTSKSLVVVDHNPNDTRYRLLETLRAFALDTMKAAGEELELRQLHYDHFKSVLQKHSYDELMNRFDLAYRHVDDIHNFRSAMDWSESRGDFESSAEIAVRLMGVWFHAGYQTEGIQRLRQLANSVAIEQDLFAKCLVVLAHAEGLAGNGRRIGDLTTQALHLSEGGPFHAAALQIRALALVTEADGIDNAREANWEAHKLAVKSGQPRTSQACLGTYTSIRLVDGEFDEVIDIAQENLFNDQVASHGDLMLRLHLAGAAILKDDAVIALQEGIQMIRIGRALNYQGSGLYEMLGHVVAAIALTRLENLPAAAKYLADVMTLYLKTPLILVDVNIAIGFGAFFVANEQPSRAYRILKRAFDPMGRQELPFRDSASIILHNMYFTAARESLGDLELKKIETSVIHSDLRHMLLEACDIVNRQVD